MGQSQQHPEVSSRAAQIVSSTSHLDQQAEMETPVAADDASTHSCRPASGSATATAHALVSMPQLSCPDSCHPIKALPCAVASTPGILEAVLEPQQPPMPVQPQSTPMDADATLELPEQQSMPFDDVPATHESDVQQICSEQAPKAIEGLHLPVTLSAEVALQQPGLIAPGRSAEPSTPDVHLQAATPEHDPSGSMIEGPSRAPCAHAMGDAGNADLAHQPSRQELLQESLQEHSASFWEDLGAGPSADNTQDPIAHAQPADDVIATATSPMCSSLPRVRISSPVRPINPVARQHIRVDLPAPNTISRHPVYVQAIQQTAGALLSGRAKFPSLQLADQLEAAAVQVSAAEARPPLESECVRYASSC